ncbi:MAG TPA: DNA primase noncatalytic subunit PriX [Nitrososphaerales archaeon]|nr:DNA primase noncatalytic subunit PriX [Nitrososphaerales archaeon]
MSSSSGSELTELELRYPFTPRSRRFFESIPVEEGLTSGDVVQQAKSRLMEALGRTTYEPHLSELIEFSSFFVAALLASRDGYLAVKFGVKEGERAKVFFVKETPASKVEVFSECFGLILRNEGDQGYSVRFEDYLRLTSKLELSKSSVWKLSRQTLDDGIVLLSDNVLNDFFGACAERAIEDGARNMKRASFPKQLSNVLEEVMKYVPVPKTMSSRRYAYVEDLLSHPVSDGRHRLVWMVLAPYLVNVKKLEDGEAIEKIRSFVSVAGESADMRKFIEYNVKRARRNGLMPPSFDTLKTERPDLYSLLPPAVIGAQSKPRDSRTSQR